MHGFWFYWKVQSVHNLPQLLGEEREMLLEKKEAAKKSE